jgi:two-component system cell cycle sensor histidine kinase/response regulator CckA
VILSCVDDLACLPDHRQCCDTIAELQRGAIRAMLLTKELQIAPRPPVKATRPMDLNEVVAPTATSVSRLTGGRTDVQLQLSRQPVPVLAQQIDIERILLNLVLNARDATAGDGLITIETAIVGRTARLTVADTGCGLTPDVQQRMFEPHFTTKRMGTGLGLSSVAGIVQNLGGTIAVHSEPGRGTSVSILLPLASELHRTTGEGWSPT